MRLLAAELGSGVMSLYKHVTDKDDLLDCMVDLVAAEIELPPAKAEWKEDLRSTAISAYKVLLSHPWATGIWGSRNPGLAKNRYHESILRVLREAGFSEELACQGYHALTMHVVGFAMQVLEMPFSNKDEMFSAGKKALETLSEQNFPYLVEHVEFHLKAKNYKSDFKYILDLILDGLDRDFAQSRK